MLRLVIPDQATIRVKPGQPKRQAVSIHALSWRAKGLSVSHRFMPLPARFYPNDEPSLALSALATSPSHSSRVTPILAKRPSAPSLFPSGHATGRIRSIRCPALPRQATGHPDSCPVRSYPGHATFRSVPRRAILSQAACLPNPRLALPCDDPRPATPRPCQATSLSLPNRTKRHAGSRPVAPCHFGPIDEPSRIATIPAKRPAESTLLSPIDKPGQSPPRRYWPSHSVTPFSQETFDD